MKSKEQLFVIFILIILAQHTRLCAQSGTSVKYPVVTAPPYSFFEKVREKDREATQEFYKKYIDIKGIPVVAADEVADLALGRTYEIVTHMLAGRPDILKGLVDRGMYLVIIGADQVYTDLPENRNARNPDYLSERVRGTGGFPTIYRNAVNKGFYKDTYAIGNSSEYWCEIALFWQGDFLRISGS